MPQDHEGNTIQVGDNLWLPVIITGIMSNGTVVLKTAYSNTSLGTAVQGSDGHKPANFPDRP